VAFSIIPQILDAEGQNFYRTDRRWQPKNLIPDPYRRNLLKFAETKLNQVVAAIPEFRQLDRAPLYVKLINRMRIDFRKAKFAWNTDDLEFIRSISKFFTDYGQILQNLKFDEARGRL
jgi:hypothetical protein